MPIQVTNKDIGTRGITSANLSDFAGRDRQVVIQVDDPKGYRPVIMDGTTVGGKTKVALVDDLNEYAKKTEIPEVPPAPDLSPYATKANPAFTGTATLNAKTIATTDQIPDTSGFLTESDLTEIEAGITDLQEQISDKTPDYGILGALPDNNVTQLSNLKVTNSTLADYAGVNAQLVYNTDTKQWVSMDGVTQGGIGSLVGNNGNYGLSSVYSEVSESDSPIEIGYDRPDTQTFTSDLDTPRTLILRFAERATKTVTNLTAIKVAKIKASLDNVTANYDGTGITTFKWLNGDVPTLDSAKQNTLVVCFLAGNEATISLTQY